MKFQKGHSGNPAGKRPGTAKIEPLRVAIRDHVPEIIAALVARAKDGDVGAARLLLERAIPAVKPIQEPIPVEMPGETLTEKAGAILGAVARGELAPMDAKALLDGLGAVAKIAEIDELERRITALEAARR
jgi:hypothetical protein